MRGDFSITRQDSGSVRYHRCRLQCSSLQGGGTSRWSRSLGDLARGCWRQMPVGLAGTLLLTSVPCQPYAPWEPI